MNRGSLLTSLLLGDSSTKLPGLAIRDMNDSTLNCDPRLITEKKSTPNTLANSLRIELARRESFSNEVPYEVFVINSATSTISNNVVVRLLKY